MKLITWNVNGIRARQAQLSDLVAAEQPDIICLQEIKASPDQIPALLAAPEGYWCYWHGEGGYSGVAILASCKVFADRPAFSHPSFDMERRIVVMESPALRVVSVYVPNGGKDYPAKLAFFESMVRWAAETPAQGQAVVLCGDLNIAREERDVHPKERKPNQIGTRPEERALLSRLIEGGLVDVGRSLDPHNDELFTWWAPWRNLRQRNIGWRIDYVMASPSLAGHAVSARSMREFGTSDHAPQVVDFNVPLPS